MKSSSILNNRRITFLSWIVLIMGWYVLSFQVHTSLILPSPLAVAKAWFQQASQFDTYVHIFHSLVRLFIAYGLSLLIALPMGFFSGKHEPVQSFFALFIGFVKTTPVLAIVVLAIIWLPSYGVPIFVSLLVMIPLIEGAVRQGVKDMDGKLLEMSHIYGVSRFKQFQCLYLPFLSNYLKTGSLMAIGIGFKAIIAAEVLASPVHGIGTGLWQHKLYLETDHVMAWTIWAVFISLIIDYCFKTGSHKHD
ncbi:ABC transporter permease [Spirochaeta cellobiosiphila]|uniref:ABC transporter permease n=1 Tax=Spirochaeta cellobiosiphila TaxID=504483 RepID=UPI00048FECC7|nr:ABC transporter permease subunit [Spirochaeta cellobiosiphila]